MNKSIFWRTALVVAVILMWGVSLFPYQDRPFIDVLLAEARERHVEAVSMTKLEDAIKKAQALFDASEAKRLQDGVREPNAPSNLPEALIQVADADPDLNLRDFVPLTRTDKPSNREVVESVQRIARGRIRLGTDLRGGTEFVIAFDPDDTGDKTEVQVRDQIIEILRNRLDSTGTLGADIRPTGDNRISILIPATDPADVAKFRELLERPAHLEFRRVHPETDSQAGRGMPPVGWIEMTQNISHEGVRSTAPIWVADTPEGPTGAMVDDAFAQRGQFGDWQVVLRFNTEGARLFGEVTGGMVGQRLSIVLDGMVQSAPTINDQIFGTAEISGDFTEKEAHDLSAVLRSGNLPVDISVEGTNTTAPTLGHATVRSGVLAALGGMVVVVLFMLVYYRLPGFVAVAALVINALLVLGTMPILDAALTLPGIAGMILTIGMAVDANVLIFERIREETENGKNIHTAIRNGYDKVFSTILDANLTTLFTAFFLYKFGSGPIKGFAVTLSIGIVASMFTALFVTRLIFDFMLETNMLKKVSMMHLFKRTSIDFISRGRLAIICSCVAIVASLAILGLKGGRAYAIDFTGGAQLQYTYAERAPIDDVVATLQAAGYKSATAAYKDSPVAGASTLEILLRQESLPADDPATENTNERQDAVAKVRELVNTAHPGLALSEGQTQDVGALVGAEFREQALIAMGLSMLAMIVYISFRFEFGYAVGAVTCLIHDVIITTGVFLIWGHREISLTAIAALLTIIGYSLNDTIVVFDRIRENISLEPKAKLSKIVNESINQTMSRTILTSLTTLFVVVVLYLFGGSGINDFAAIMIAGIILGTYSTVFIATPVMMMWQRYRHKVSHDASAAELVPEHAPAQKPAAKNATSETPA